MEIHAHCITLKPIRRTQRYSDNEDRATMIYSKWATHNSIVIAQHESENKKTPPSIARMPSAEKCGMAILTPILPPTSEKCIPRHHPS